MRPKLSYVQSQDNRKDGIAMIKRNIEDDDRRLDETLLQLENDSIMGPSLLSEDWFEEEAADIEQPHIKRLTQNVEKVLQENQEYLLTYPSGLPLRISEEAVRLSRDEPGGVNACRVNLNVVAKECCSEGEIKELCKSNKEIPLKRLGSVTTAENRVIATSEVNIYLLSSSSVLCRLHTIMTSFSLKSKNGSTRLQKANLLPEFVLVKRKLFRSKNSNSSIIIKSVSN